MEKSLLSSRNNPVYFDGWHIVNVHIVNVHFIDITVNRYVNTLDATESQSFGLCFYIYALCIKMFNFNLPFFCCKVIVLCCCTYSYQLLRWDLNDNKLLYCYFHIQNIEYFVIFCCDIYATYKAFGNCFGILLIYGKLHCHIFSRIAQVLSS